MYNDAKTAVVMDVVKQTTMHISQSETTKETALDHGQTDRISLAHDLDLGL